MKKKVYVTEEEAKGFASIFGEAGFDFFEDENGKYFIQEELKPIKE